MRIKKGSHYSGFHFGILCEPSVSKSVMFDNTAVYENTDNHINKLFGFTYGLVHKNSARFGWRYDSSKSKVEILAYVYKNGQRILENTQNLTICYVDLNKTYRYELYMDGHSYVFKVFNEVEMIGRATIEAGYKMFPIKFKCYPYFGGVDTAPHTITFPVFQ